MKPVRRWIVKAWWGHPRQRSQHSASMVVWSGEVRSTTRAGAKSVAMVEIRQAEYREGVRITFTTLTASPVREVKP